MRRKSFSRNQLLISSYSEQKHLRPTSVPLKHRLKEHVTFLNKTFVNKTFQLRFFLEERRHLSDQNIRRVLACRQALRKQRKKREENLRSFPFRLISFYAKSLLAGYRLFPEKYWSTLRGKICFREKCPHQKFFERGWLPRRQLC